jgi:hypothetical protein
VDLFGQHRSHDRMVQGPRTIGDIALNEPRRSAPLTLDLLQSGMTPAAWAEPVGTAGELRLVIRLQQGADHFLQQLIRPCRQPQRTLLRRILLVDIRAPHRGPPIALMPQRLDDRLDLSQAHAVRGLRAGAWCHSAVVAVDLPVSTQIKLRIEQVPGDYSFIAFLDFSAPKLWRAAQRKVFHNSTGKDERFLRMTGNPGHSNGPSF